MMKIPIHRRRFGWAAFIFSVAVPFLLIANVPSAQGADKEKIAVVKVDPLKPPGLQTLRAGDRRYFTSFVFDPSGKTIITVGTAIPDGLPEDAEGWKKAKGDLRIWKISTGQQIARLGDDSRPFGSIAIPPDGKTFATSEREARPSKAGIIKIWDLQTRQVVRTLTGHADGIGATAYSSDGQLLASGSYDATAKIFDAATGRELKTLRCPDEVRWLQFSPDHKILVTNGFTTGVIFWDWEAGIERANFKTPGECLVGIDSSPDGKQVAVGCVRYNDDGVSVSGATPGIMKLLDVAYGRDRIFLRVHNSWSMQQHPHG